ncbi:stage III sporulation protein AG [Faecalimicrobium dakarense]|uniref:stage III sporulation protein AG n=1 Tax=Faecalimicrobium dakarense TaxID=1301100 RepID=UPI0004B813E1|nr:stage III sporulation protein AG [[Clostridium] dakarense]
MFKNLNEKDKKKIYSLLSLGVICAIALIVLPSFSNDKKGEEEKNAKADKQTEVSKENEHDAIESKLKNILSKIEGVGDVHVMITFESSEEIQPAFNSNSSTEKTQETDAKGGERTVTTSNENKTMITSSSNNPVVLKTNEAKIKGVVIVSSGASDPKIKETIYSVAQTALQVSGHQIEVTY